MSERPTFVERVVGAVRAVAWLVGRRPQLQPIPVRDRAARRRPTTDR
jgi:hypothetical protein